MFPCKLINFFRVYICISFDVSCSDLKNLAALEIQLQSVTEFLNLKFCLIVVSVLLCLLLYIANLLFHRTCCCKDKININETFFFVMCGTISNDLYIAMVANWIFELSCCVCFFLVFTLMARSDDDFSREFSRNEFLLLGRKAVVEFSVFQL